MTVSAPIYLTLVPHFLSHACSLFNLWWHCFCILTLFIGDLPKYAPFSVWFYMSFKYSLLSSTGLIRSLVVFVYFLLHVLSNVWWNHAGREFLTFLVSCRFSSFWSEAFLGIMGLQVLQWSVTQCLIMFLLGIMGL